MPPIIVQVPGKEETITFPDGTSHADARLYLGRERANDFPLIAEELDIESANRTRLQGDFDKLQPGFLTNPRLAFKQGLGNIAGGLRGIIGTVLDKDAADEEFGPGLSRFMRGGLIASAGGPTLGEAFEGAAVGFQKMFGNPTLPGTDTRLFPTPAPPLVDELTGESDSAREFGGIQFQRAIRNGLTHGVLGQVGKSVADWLLPPEEFGHEFEVFEPTGFLEGTAFGFADLFGRLPEFWAGGKIGGVVAGRAGAALGVNPAKSQALGRLGHIAGAFGFAGATDTAVAEWIDEGMPGTLEEWVTRSLAIGESGAKGTAIGLALVGGQALGGAVFGVPAAFLGVEAIGVALGRWAGGTLAFGTVPNVLDGVPVSVDGYYDAAMVMAVFGIGESVLARKVARQRQPNIDKALAGILAEGHEYLLPPPPGRNSPRTRVKPSTIEIEGDAHREFFDKNTPEPGSPEAIEQQAAVQRLAERHRAQAERDRAHAEGKESTDAQFMEALREAQREIQTDAKLGEIEALEARLDADAPERTQLGIEELERATRPDILAEPEGPAQVQPKQAAEAVELPQLDLTAEAPRAPEITPEAALRARADAIKADQAASPAPEVVRETVKKVQESSDLTRRETFEEAEFRVKSALTEDLEAMAADPAARLGTGDFDLMTRAGLRGSLAEKELADRASNIEPDVYAIGDTVFFNGKEHRVTSEPFIEDMGKQSMEVQRIKPVEGEGKELVVSTPRAKAQLQETDRKLRQDEQAAIKRVREAQQAKDDVGEAGAELKAQAEAETLAGEAKTSEPGTVDPKFPVEDISVDFKRFQFKDEKLGSLKDVKTFDPNRGGLIQVWRDPADGKVYVVNGHNRLDLAKRTGQKDVTVRFIDAKTEGDARAVGALTNISEGRGTSLDAAKFFKETGLTREELIEQGVPMTQSTAAEGMALSQLHPALFAQVVSGEMKPARAAIIGEKLPDQGKQFQLAEEIAKQEKKGKSVTNGMVSELVDSMNRGPSRTETQETLFGEETTSTSLIFDRARLTASLRARLGKDKKLAGIVKRNVEGLERAGNVLDAKGTADLSGEAARLLEIFDAVKDMKGPVSDILNRGSERIGKGEDAKKVNKEIFEELREALPEIITGVERTGDVPSAEPAPPDARRGQAEEVDQGSLFDIEDARAEARPDGEAMEQLVDTLRFIEETPAEGPAQQRAKLFDSIEAVSRMSGESLTLRRAEARNVAEQITDKGLVAPGESVADIIAVDATTGNIRIRTRTEDGVINTLDVPGQGIRGVAEFIEADRRARATMETAVAGREKMMQLDGTKATVLERLTRELERLANDETGAVVNPFSVLRKKFKRQRGAKDPGYLPPEWEQATRPSLMSRRDIISAQVDLLENALRNPDLNARDRRSVEERLALKREERRIYEAALQIAPFAALDPRVELDEENYNDLRTLARNMKIEGLGKNPKKYEIVDAIVAERSKVRGQITAPGLDFEIAQRAFKRFNEEQAAGVNRYRDGFNAAADALLRQVSATHTIIRDLRNLKKEHPEYGEMYNAAIRETELIRSGGPTGARIAYRMHKEFFGGLSRSEQAMLNKVARWRADIAQNIANPRTKGTTSTVEANKALKNLAAQEPDTFAKVNERIDIMQKEFQAALDLAVKEGLVTEGAADSMRKIGEFLPTRYAELTDPRVLGVGDPYTPRSSPIRRRGGGFEVERTALFEMTIQQLRDTARDVGVRGNLSNVKYTKLVKMIEQAAGERGARVLDTKFLTTEYYTNLHASIQRNRAAQSLAQIANEFPSNGIVRQARESRDPQGRITLEEPDAAHEVIQYREEGQIRGIVVDRQFADAFHLRTQNLGGLQPWLPAIGMATGARITKMFATGALGPEFAAVALPRDFFHMRISTDVLGHSTYKSWLPGVGEAMIAKDIATVTKDVLMRGPLTTEYLENGGAMDYLAQASLFQKGEHVTDSIRAGIVDLQLAESNSAFLSALKDVSFNGALHIKGVTIASGGKMAENFYKTMQYTNSSAELMSRVAEYHRRKRQIAKEKGVNVEDLEAVDFRTAAYSVRSRIDFADGGNLLRFIEEFIPYTRASVQALRGPGRTTREAIAAGVRQTGAVKRKLKGEDSRPEDFTREDAKTLANAGSLAFELLSFPMMAYAINRHNNEQGLKDIPSWAKGDIIFVLPAGLGVFKDEFNNPRQGYARLPVDQSLYLFNALGYNLAAMGFGDTDNVDIDSMVAAASKILTLPGTSSIPLTVQLMIQPFTNRSTTLKGLALYRGAEGGIPGAEIEAGNTSPAMIRIGQLFPGISPERLQEALSGSIPDRFSARALATIANKTIGAGIEDVRLDEEGMFFQKVPGGDQLLKDFSSGGSAVAAQFEIDKKAIAGDNLFKGLMERNFLSSRKRNGGELVFDKQLMAEIASVNNKRHSELFRNILERTIEFEKINASSTFPNVWRGILRSEPKLAAVKYYASLAEMVPGRDGNIGPREVLESELGNLRQNKVKTKTWFKEFLKQVRAFEPEWNVLVQMSKEGDAGKIFLEFLEAQGARGAVPEFGLGTIGDGRFSTDEEFADALREVQAQAERDRAHAEGKESTDAQFMEALREAQREVQANP